MASIKKFFKPRTKELPDPPPKPARSSIEMDAGADKIFHLWCFPRTTTLVANFFPPILERENALSFVLVCISENEMIGNVVCKWLTSCSCKKYHNLKKKIDQINSWRVVFELKNLLLFSKFPSIFPKISPPFLKFWRGNSAFFENRFGTSGFTQTRSINMTWIMNYW